MQRPKPRCKSSAWSKSVVHKKPVIQGVHYVMWGNSHKGLRTFLVAGFVYTDRMPGVITNAVIMRSRKKRVIFWISLILGLLLLIDFLTRSIAVETFGMDFGVGIVGALLVLLFVRSPALAGYAGAFFGGSNGLWIVPLIVAFIAYKTGFVPIQTTINSSSEYNRLPTLFTWSIFRSYKFWIVSTSVMIFAGYVYSTLYLPKKLGTTCGKWSAHMTSNANFDDYALEPDDILRKIYTDTSSLNVQQKYEFWYQQCLRERYVR